MLRGMRARVAGAVGFGAFAAFGAHAENDEATLRARLAALAERLDRIDGAERASFAAKRVAPAQAVSGGEFPGSWKLPGSETSISFGGYVKADAFLTRGAAHTAVGDSFVVSSIPLGRTAAARQGGDFRLHARESRLRFETSTPTDAGRLKTTIEGDFYGAGGNQRFANSTTFALYHAFAQFGPTLIGHTNSTFADRDTAFDTVDFAGPVGQEYNRQAQIRRTVELGETLDLDLAIENPEGRTMTPTGGTDVNVVDKLPDFVAALRYKDSWGAVNLSGVLARVTYDDGLGASDSNWGTMLHAGGHVKLTEEDKISLVANYGLGLGRYMYGGAPSMAVECRTGRVFAAGCGARLHAVEMWGGWVGYTRKWSEAWRSSIHYGLVRNNIPVDVLGAAGAQGRVRALDSLHLNAFWSPVERVEIGVEWMWGWRRDAAAPDGSSTSGRAERAQAAIKFLF